MEIDLLREFLVKVVHGEEAIEKRCGIISDVVYSAGFGLFRHIAGHIGSWTLISSYSSL